MRDESKLPLSRRAFLTGSAGLWISAGIPRPVAAATAEQSAAPRSFETKEWRAVEAITTRILPTDDTPGAREAGCVNFIDKALAAEDAEALPLYRRALAALDGLCRRRFDGGFASLDGAAQDAVLRELESGSVKGWKADDADPAAFFATVRLHTILGFVSDPRHGGNRDYVGWRTLGYPGSVHHLGGATPEQVRGEAPFVPVWERPKGRRHSSHE